MKKETKAEGIKRKKEKEGNEKLEKKMEERGRH